jgi:protein subunit release factor A
MTLVRKKDIKFEPIGSTGPGGQHVNRNKTGVRATHVPTGLVCVIRGRSLQDSKRKAVGALRERVNLEAKQRQAKSRKSRWRKAISERNIIRTYHFGRGEVKDHRTGATAPLKEVLGKGNLDALRMLQLMGVDVDGEKTA